MSPALLLLAAIHAAPQAELLDFTAVWCGPCQQMAPVVTRLQREGFPIRQVDVDRERDLANQYKIQGIPAFVLVVNGREVGRLVGAQKEVELRKLLQQIPIPSAQGAAEAQPKKSFIRWPWGGKKAEPSEAPVFSDTPDVKRGQSPDPVAVVPSTAPSAARDPMQTAVRIRVKDERGIDYGSGTVIGSKEGQALVLTCYHIFRDFGKDAAVEIDLFPNGPQGEAQTFVGKLVASDEEADAALVGVTGCGMIPVSPLVAAEGFPKAGDHVFSVGCGNGEPPTKLQHTVTRINPYEGAETTECTGMPVVGRSGGGLFDRNGRVIGVCFAQARETKTGVYVGATEIHELLCSAGYSKLVPAAGATSLAIPDPARRGMETESPFEDGPAGSPGEAPGEVTGPVADLGAIGAAPEPRPSTVTGGDHTDALAALAAGAEVVCTIRPLKPGGRTEVVVINKASSRFLRYLRGELEEPTVETSMRVPAGSGREARNFLPVAAARVPAVGVALLRRVFDNRDRF